MPTRLGVVSYFNARPLVHALESGDLTHDFELVYDVPSRCAEKLHAGETDVALIPSIEIALAPQPYRIVPEAAIASHGPVSSVLLVMQTEPDRIRTLASDSGSRTSVALTRILLAKQFGCRPDIVARPPDVDQMLAEADAALIIGDAALDLDTSRYRVLDLGEAWTGLTGLPFVYACWTGPPGALAGSQASILVRALTLGLSCVHDIADDHAEGHPGSPEFYRRYLQQSISYHLGEDELAGLRLFYRYAEDLGLVDRQPDLSFYPLI